MSDRFRKNTNNLRSGNAAQKVAVFGVCAALALALSFFESLLPPLFSLPVGVKLGLSNVVTMTCAATVGMPCALAVTVVKGLFAGLTRGFVAMMMSLAGGIISAVVVSLLMKVRIGYLVISVIGAIVHNMAQLTMSILFVSNTAVFIYAPVLIFLGIIAGCITGSILCLLVRSRMVSKIKNL